MSLCVDYMDIEFFLSVVSLSTKMQRFCKKMFSSIGTDLNILAPKDR